MRLSQNTNTKVLEAVARRICSAIVASIGRQDGHILSRVVDARPGQGGFTHRSERLDFPSRAVGTEIFSAFSMNSASVAA